MATAKITSKGQITIPRRIREHLHVAEGDRIDFRVVEDGTVRLVPLSRPVRELFGLLHRPGRKPVSLKEMDEAIAAGREEADRRTRAPRREGS
jgi:AbrB family looped-hinge helix DNA binding protein